MNYRCLFTIFALAVPLVTGNYGPSSSYLPNSGGLSELVKVASGGSQHEANSLASAAEVQPSAAEAARLNTIRAQLNVLNSNPTYQNLRNSESIAESVAENNLANNIRTGNINLVSPNVVDQGIFRSLLVPSGRNNHQVIATQPLPPIIVNQPGAPPAQVTSGPAAIVKAAPVIYKMRPSVIFQQEVINKVPTPLSLNPVYVKVYKPGRKIDAPVAPVYNQPSPSYAANSNAASDSYNNAGTAPYAAQYSAQPSYAPSQQAYGPAQPSYAPASY